MITELDLRPNPNSPTNEPRYTYQEAVKILRSLGITDEQMVKITGFGHRRGYACFPDDSIVAKFAAGALSAIGVCGVIFGTDSPQHHNGHNL
jgi:hypothetical protein